MEASGEAEARLESVLNTSAARDHWPEILLNWVREHFRVCTLSSGWCRAATNLQSCTLHGLQINPPVSVNISAKPCQALIFVAFMSEARVYAASAWLNSFR